MEDNNVKEKKHFFHKKEKKTEVAEVPKKKKKVWLIVLVIAAIVIVLIGTAVKNMTSQIETAANTVEVEPVAVSYTHLDVYKRQTHCCMVSVSMR